MAVEKIVCLFEAGLRHFRIGAHVPEPPTEEGIYPIWARDGGFRGYVEVTREGRSLRYRLGNRTSGRARDLHVGWWWSKPVPPLPAAPDWSGNWHPEAAS